MKKAFDQTVRDLKREVNKKVLKVPVIEQKILDATSNEPWGPHGSHLADIAQATRNFHEYQMIMSVLWKRVNDTGKNWRHVYKALTVLEYLVAHGSERVIDEIKEHAYQISTLSDFQYIDSSGRDQGSNVRKKSQSLVTLVNDKERIQEVRQKAYANRDKFRTGGMHKSSSYSGAVGGYGDRYDDDRYEGQYGSRDDDRGGYGKDKDCNYRDEDGYRRGADSYSRDGDPYGRTDDRYNRDGYRDSDYRSRGNDDNQFGPRNRSFDGERNRPGDEDDRYSSRSGGGRGDEYYQDERRLERKLSSQHSAPPAYEDAVAEAQRHNNEESDGGSVGGSVHKASTQLGSTDQSQSTAAAPITTTPVSKEVSDFDEFDPRGSVAGPTSTAGADNDLLGSLMGPSSPSALAITPVLALPTTSGADAFADPGFGTTFVAVPPTNSTLGQPSEDLFGNSPFKAMPTQEPATSQSQNSAATTAFSAPITNEGLDTLQPSVSKVENISDFGFGESFQALTYTPTAAPPQENLAIPPAQLPTQPPPQQYLQPPQAPQMQQQYILEQPPQAPQMQQQYILEQPPQLQQLPPQYVQMQPTIQLPSQPPMQSSPQLPSQPQTQQPQSYLQSQVPTQAQPYMQPQPESHIQIQPHQSGDVLGNLLPQSAPTVTPSSQTAGLADMTLKPQTQKDKFEPKSAVWADTLSRGLVNLNISGPKINPLADIGIDFDSINRIDKRKEKEKAAAAAAAAASSSGAMGKAMGAGSGIGRAGATGLAPPSNPMMGSGMGMGGGMGMGMGMGNGAGMGMGGGMGMGMGMGMGNGAGMGMGGYGAGMNQSMGMGMGMGMGIGTAPVPQPRPGSGLPPTGPGMAGYNPMMGMGGYAPQNPYGGYR